MMRRALLVVCIVLFPFSTPARAQHPSKGQDLAVSSQVPLEAELLASLNVAKLSRGASILAKARVDWNDPACHLRVGSVIIGHVIDLEQRSKLNKGSSVTVAFDHAECDGRSTPFQFTLFAIIAIPQIDEGSPMNQNIDLFGTGSRPVGGMAGGTTAPPLVAGGASIDLRQETAARNASANVKMPTSITSGQVIGLKKVALSVGTGPDGASVLSSPKDNIHLEGATQLILVPNPTAPSAPAPVLAANASQPVLTPTAPIPEPKLTPAPTPPTVVAPVVDETSICTDPCSLVPTTDELKPLRASLVLSNKSLGYIPHDLGDHVSFGFESTISYLDAENILFTYDPHHLRQRFPSGFTTESMRTIRAVLLDPAKLRVKRILDWQILGEGQYIWRTGSGEILVHLGHNLRLLGPDLAVRRQIPISGRLVFVAASPSGDHIAVGVLHERHTRTMHDDLVEHLKSDPEEDVDVQLLDHNLSVLFTTRQSSALPPPILSDAGEIRLNTAGKNRWRIREFRWDHTEHTIATLTSECRPNISTPLPDSIFLVGCGESHFENWYRMIRLDGHLILSGRGSPLDLEQCSSSSQGTFAVRVVRSRRAKLRGEYFGKNDLIEQEISVYRSSDGKRLFYTANPGVSLAQQSFAISPSGAQVAILSDVAISLYQVAKAASSP